MKLDKAKLIADEIISRLEPYCHRVEIAGSVRRRCPEVGDIEIVCIPSTMPQPETLFSARDCRLPGFSATFTGYKILKGDLQSGRYIQLLHPEGIKVDLFTAHANNWGYIYAIRTGSADFSRFLASCWVKRGFKGIDGNLCRDGVPVAAPDEQTFFNLLRLSYVQPEKRIKGGITK